MKTKNGSISILIIIIMSTIFLFGLYLYHNYKTDEELANLTYDLFVEEQKLNRDATIALYKIENILEESKALTLNYMSNKEYSYESSDIVYQVIHEKLQNDFYSQDVNEESYYNMANSLYFYLVNARLENLVNDVPSLSILKGTNEGLIQYIYVEMNFKDEAIKNNLEVNIEIGDFPYDITLENIDEVKNITFSRNNNNLFNIETFRLN